MKNVLCLGHCGFDSPKLKSVLETNFDVKVELVSTGSEAHKRVQSGGVDLVLVNRIFDRDGDSGISWIKENQASAAPAPAMLVSNYADAQAEAVGIGALPGFGKSELSSPSLITKIKAALG